MRSCVSKVAWAEFQDSGAGSTLCMLQQSLLTTYTLSGQLQTAPVPAAVTSLHPIPQGLLLNVSVIFKEVPGPSCVLKRPACFCCSLSGHQLVESAGRRVVRCLGAERASLLACVGLAMSVAGRLSGALTSHPTNARVATMLYALVTLECVGQNLSKRPRAHPG